MRGKDQTNRLIEDIYRFIHRVHEFNLQQQRQANGLGKATPVSMETKVDDME